MNLSRQAFLARVTGSPIDISLSGGTSTVRIGVEMEPHFTGTIIAMNQIIPFKEPRAEQGMPFAYKRMVLSGGPGGNTLVFQFEGINRLSADTVAERLPGVVVSGLFNYLSFISALQLAVSGIAFTLVD